MMFLAYNIVFEVIESRMESLDGVRQFGSQSLGRGQVALTVPSRGTQSLSSLNELQAGSEK